jgi:hypothetical protein
MNPQRRNMPLVMIHSRHPDSYAVTMGILIPWFVFAKIYLVGNAGTHMGKIKWQE